MYLFRRFGWPHTSDYIFSSACFCTAAVCLFHCSFAAIATSSTDSPNQFKRPTPVGGGGHSLSGSGNNSVGNGNNNNNNNNASPQSAQGAAATANEDSRMDSVAYRALLRNELLDDNIDDIRVSFRQSPK